MDRFTLNGLTWTVVFVKPDDIRLVDRTDKYCVATTDPKTLCVYISDAVTGDFLTTVLLHELSHCAIISYGLMGFIRSYIRQEDWIPAEEWLCNYIADYGRKIFDVARKLLGNKAITQVPIELDRYLANKR